MTLDARERLIVALDLPSVKSAEAMVARLAESVDPNRQLGHRNLFARLRVQNVQYADAVFVSLECDPAAVFG